MKNINEESSGVSRTTEESHVMIDLETLGIDNDSVILSMGMVRFNINTGEILDKKYLKFNPRSCEILGMKISFKTVSWWMNQNDEAIEHAFKGDGVDINDIVPAVKSFASIDDYVWAKSPSFDLEKINYVFKMLGSVVPWMFYNERDVRTINWVGEDDSKIVPFEGVAHNPLDDCIHQIKQVCMVLGMVKQNEEASK